MPNANDVINIALQQKGISGRPNKFTNWYGVNDEWCAMFVCWCCAQAGISTGIVPKTAAVQGLMDFAKSHGRFKLKGSGYKPKAGDIFIQKSNGASHTGFVVSSTDSKFTSIEGNCGNAVKSQTHSLSEKKLTGFFVPAYPSSGAAEITDAAETGAKEKKEITKTIVKNTDGTKGAYMYNNLLGAVVGDENYYELLIENDTIYRPVIAGEISLTRERKGSPSVCKFTVLKDDVINFREGNPVKFKVGGENVFYGYIFSKSRKDNVSIEVTAYDQLRYLKNKDSYIYENKKYSDLLKMIAEDYNLKLGDIADTGYTIERRVEEGTLFDILGTASDLTVIRTGKLYVLYDDFGSLTLKNIEDMQTDVFIDNTQLQGYDYKTSIDSDTYNRVRLAKDNEETGEREFYDFNGTENQAKWGILQLYEKLDDNSGDISLRGKSMLDYYNVLGRSLRLTNVFGDTRVRGGSSVTVNLDLGDIVLNNKLIVEKVTHKFTAGSHFMDLQLSGLRGELR